MSSIALTPMHSVQPSVDTIAFDQTPKKPPNKKRHTKPCRFYQTNKCPHSAEECDFAHILTGESTFQNAKPCRYYVAGHCSNGVWCRYKHSVDRHVDDYDRRALESPDIRDIEPATTQRQTQTRPNAQLRPSVYIPPNPVPLQGMYLSSSRWPPYPDAFPSSSSYPNDFTVPQSFQTHLTSPTNSSDSVTSLATSPSSSVSDDVVMIIDDAHTIEPPGRYRATSFADEHPPIPCTIVSPFYHTPDTPVNMTPMSPAYPMLSPTVGYYSPKPPASPDPSSRSRSQSRSIVSRQKAANYKTKPCKFYKLDSPCPNGDTCTFVHDNSETRLKSPSPLPADGFSEGESGRKLQHGLPPKPVTLREENSKKGYFPVSWRVIGGGVLVGGGKSRSSSEGTCTLADEERGASESGELSGHPHTHQSRNPKTLVPAGDAHFPVSPVIFPSTSEEGDTGEGDTPTKRSAPRVRATSIPPTPSTSHVNILTLFSAESPGGL